MSYRFLSALALSAVLGDQGEAGVFFQSTQRLVYIDGSILLTPLMHDFEESVADYANLLATGNASWLSWDGTMESSQESFVGYDSVYVEGQVSISSLGSRQDSNPFNAIGAGAFRTTFVVDEPAPYELYAWAWVHDSPTMLDWTDVKFYLRGPAGLVEQIIVWDEDGEYWHAGVLQPGEYHLDVEALGRMWAYSDDWAAAQYRMSFSIVPEPATIIFLVTAAPIIFVFHRARSKRENTLKSITLEANRFRRNHRR